MLGRTLGGACLDARLVVLALRCMLCAASCFVLGCDASGLRLLSLSRAGLHVSSLACLVSCLIHHRLASFLFVSLLYLCLHTCVSACVREWYVSVGVLEVGVDGEGGETTRLTAHCRCLACKASSIRYQVASVEVKRLTPHACTHQAPHASRLHIGQAPHASRLTPAHNC